MQPVLRSSEANTPQGNALQVSDDAYKSSQYCCAWEAGYMSAVSADLSVDAILEVMSETNTQGKCRMVDEQWDLQKTPNAAGTKHYIDAQISHPSDAGSSMGGPVLLKEARYLGFDTMSRPGIGHIHPTSGKPEGYPEIHVVIEQVNASKSHGSICRQGTGGQCSSDPTRHVVGWKEEESGMLLNSLYNHITTGSGLSSPAQIAGQKRSSNRATKLRNLLLGTFWIGSTGRGGIWLEALRRPRSCMRLRFREIRC
ncbi:alpha-ketoglutarate-dependent taurine dioxygenase [Zalerion maritima]|uniref:Alpha-ketoglutarate-dependent taurine dioxygenase n=1 Tax=Zalerion maritima TaxID=339359 RepID=A0AAD5S445_9PEZI|nr:alpha-ketoglutarate-dependent taurine dioxygenase [Zalerion maritima]